MAKKHWRGRGSEKTFRQKTSKDKKLSNTKKTLRNFELPKLQKIISKLYKNKNEYLIQKKMLSKNLICPYPIVTYLLYDVICIVRIIFQRLYIVL